MSTYFLKTQADYGDKAEIGNIISFPYSEFLKSVCEIPKWDSYIFIIFEHHNCSSFVDFIECDIENDSILFKIRATGSILNHVLEHNVQKLRAEQSEIVGRYFLYYDLMFSSIAIKTKPQNLAQRTERIDF